MQRRPPGRTWLALPLQILERFPSTQQRFHRVLLAAFLLDETVFGLTLNYARALYTHERNQKPSVCYKTQTEVSSVVSTLEHCLTCACRVSYLFQSAGPLKGMTAATTRSSRSTLFITSSAYLMLLSLGYGSSARRRSSFHHVRGDEVGFHCIRRRARRSELRLGLQRSRSRRGLCF
jgi:hypothetical protein